MAFNLASLIPTAVSLISGISAQKSADKQRNKQVKYQRELLRRQLEFFDTMRGQVEELDKSGAFDPEVQIEQLEKDTAKYEARDAGNMAGAYRVAGYQPGDSAVEKGLNANKLSYRQDLDRMRTQLRRSSAMDKLNAYSQIPGGMLNTGISVAGANAQAAQANRPNLGGMLASVMPYLGQIGGGSGSSQRASGFSLGTGGFMGFRPNLMDIGPYNRTNLNVSYS